MDITLIPNWRNKNLRCHFCGSTESVKYEKEIFDPVIDNKPTKVCVCNGCALKYSLKKHSSTKNNHTIFDIVKVVVEKRQNGVQPAIFIIENGIVHMITITPDRNFDITNEGHVGERYDENGNWCGD